MEGTSLIFILELIGAINYGVFLNKRNVFGLF